MESHASAASAGPQARGSLSVRAAARRLYTSADPAISLAVATALATSAFVANGGLQLGSSTAVEVGAIAIGAVLVGAAIVAIGFEARLHGGVALAAVTALGGLTALSILWSLYPSDSWIETNRTFAYVAAFAAGVAAVRLARGRWAAVTAGVLMALFAISVWGLATKVAPGWLAPDETYGRLREPYGYWNAVGVTAAMGMPLSLWLGTRSRGQVLVNALAWPLQGLLTVTMLLSFSRGSIVAAVVGIGLWLAIVPRRLASLAVLVPSSLAAAALTAWAFSKSGITDDLVPLDVREHAGWQLGLLLLAMIAILFTIGVLLQRRAERRPLSETARRRIGTAALAALAVSPLILLGALAASDRGIGGTISDRWHDLTKANAVTPQNTPSRLTETASVRSIYWSRAIDVWQKHPVAGAGAGSFGEAQLRFRNEPARGKHAHGYVLQTMADLGLAGLAVSVLALAAWALAVRETLLLRRNAIAGSRARWADERIGLVALALVAVVFGVHSSLDWTWFVPAVAITGLFCAGWVAGRGPTIELSPSSSPVPRLEMVRPSFGRGLRSRARTALALGLLAPAVLAALAVIQPWRAESKGNEALRLVAAGNYPAAADAADRAREINPLSPDPYFDLAAVADASGDRKTALTMLERAVQVEPANPEAWTRLGNYYLSPLSEPAQALPVLRGALFLDPLSDATRGALIAALRAEAVLQARALAGEQKRARAAARRQRSSAGSAHR